MAAVKYQDIIKSILICFAISEAEKVSTKWNMDPNNNKFIQLNLNKDEK